MSAVTSEVLDRVQHVHDYIQLFFRDGTIVNINNTCRVEGCSAVDELAGASVVAVAEDETSLTMDFGSQGRLIVDLRPDAFSGPEAIELNRPGEGLVVWT